MLIVDTGPLVATADRADKHHRTCRALLEGDDGRLVTTALVVAEAAYLIDRQLGPHAEVALYASIIDGSLRVEDLGPGTGGASRRWSSNTPTCGSGAPTRLLSQSPNALAQPGWPL